MGGCALNICTVAVRSVMHSHQDSPDFDCATQAIVTGIDMCMVQLESTGHVEVSLQVSVCL